MHYQLFLVERQVFDFLGYMWAPILVNFFQILFVIFGFFGAYQYRPRYLVAYTVWSLLWLGWNIFLICFYLNIGILDRDSDLLNLGTGSVSWFEENGYGCRPTYPTNVTSEDPYRPVRPEKVEGCLLEYHIVEVVHSGVHCALAVFGIFGAICLGQTFLDEDDSFDFMGGDAKSPQHTAVHPMYVSYSSLPTTNSANSTQLKQAASSAKLLLLTNGGSGGIGASGGGVGGGEEGGDGTGAGVGYDRHNHTKDQQPSSLSTPHANPAAGAVRTSGGGGGGSSSSSFGDVLKAKLNGHAGPPSNSNHHSPSNTNTLVSSSSSPSSTFTNIHSSPQSLHNAHGNSGNSYNHHQHQHHHHHHNLQHQNSTTSQPGATGGNGNILMKLSSTNSINSGGSRVILLQHQDSSESSPPPTVPARGLSRNASFSRATSAARTDHATVLNNNPLRKNSSSSVSILLRYGGDGSSAQGHRTPDPDDDTFFIPRSASSYQARAANFGISNPFNNLINGRPAGYQQRGGLEGVPTGEDDGGGRRLLLLSGSAQQLGSSTPQKRNSLVGVVVPNGGGPGCWSGRGSPVPQVPPLPQHYQRKNSAEGGNGVNSGGGANSGSAANNAYLTRSPNLNRIARRHNGVGAAGAHHNAINNNSNSHGAAAGGFPPDRGLAGGGRGGSSGRLPSTAHQCDQIREYGGGVSSAGVGVGKPLGYCAAAVPSSPPENNNFAAMVPVGGRTGSSGVSGIPVMVMHRAKSQDRLAYRSRRPGGRTFGGAGGSGGSSGSHHHHHHHQQQQQRPRSFCSNNGAYSDYVILEHPGN
uniref:Sodium/potassium-transporting ATPase subunit beta-1-interacting protein n=1 Tax=Anopheles farauti TaxID=69004 RepID=A0A182QYN6_9DIPT